MHKSKRVVDIISSKKSTISAEIIPPRNGTEMDAVYAQIEALSSANVDFISVTKGAGGSLRGGTLPIAQLIESRFQIPSLAHFTCRDYTIEEIENNLMDHHYFGVANILALRGDAPDGQPNYFKPAPNKHSLAWQLVEQITNLNAGKYIIRAGFDQKKDFLGNGLRKGQPTDFCIGVAAHPELEPFADSLSYFEKKISMGAKYGITQMLFSEAPYVKFMDEVRKRGHDIPVLPGLYIVQSVKGAEMMQEKFGSKIPKLFFDRLAKAKTKEDAKKVGIELTSTLARNLLKAGAPGIHIFVMNDAVSGATVLKSL